MPDSPEIRLKMPVCMDPSDAEEEKDMELDKSRLTNKDLTEEQDEKGTVKSKSSRCTTHPTAEQGSKPKRSHIMVASNSEGSADEFNPEEAAVRKVVNSTLEEDEECEPDSPVKPVKRKRPAEKPAPNQNLRLPLFQSPAREPPYLAPSQPTPSLNSQPFQRRRASTAR
ncbi:uncharacterized protein ACWYII_007349 [Salvelinus alpinus]